MRFLIRSEHVVLKQNVYETTLLAVDEQDARKVFEEHHPAETIISIKPAPLGEQK